MEREGRRYLCRSSSHLVAIAPTLISRFVPAIDGVVALMTQYPDLMPYFLQQNRPEAAAPQGDAVGVDAFSSRERRSGRLFGAPSAYDV